VEPADGSTVAVVLTVSYVLGRAFFAFSGPARGEAGCLLLLALAGCFGSFARSAFFLSVATTLGNCVRASSSRGCVPHTGTSLSVRNEPQMPLGT
jgi:hypothetical protein